MVIVNISSGGRQLQAKYLSDTLLVVEDDGETRTCFDNSSYTGHEKTTRKVIERYLLVFVYKLSVVSSFIFGCLVHIT